jgi:hypothetical protein
MHEQGFAIVPDIYTAAEVQAMLHIISQADTSRPTFRKTADLFAVRQALKEMPALTPLLFNKRLKSLINDYFGEGYFVVKSIYFDKPGQSNWFVDGETGAVRGTAATFHPGR